MADSYHGFEEFSEQLEKYIANCETEKVMSVLEEGANELVKDVRALPQPRRSGSGYTHLLDSVSTKRNGEEVEVGWGKYYGPMVERGTSKMRARAHMKPTFEKNKERYYKKMQEALFE